jgi:hypothetical protein
MRIERLSMPGPTVIPFKEGSYPKVFAFLFLLEIFYQNNHNAINV